MQVVKYDQVHDKIVDIRNQKVIIDADIAELYGVETKRINEAVKNNPEKFPQRLFNRVNSTRMEFIEVEIFDFKQRREGKTTYSIY